MELTKLRAMRNPKSGSFQFCQGCPSALNCCTRMKQGSNIDNAIVFPKEISEIKNITGREEEDFLQNTRYPRNHSFRTIQKFSSGGCLFHQGGRCQIYSVRPLDCRMFPFDIIEDDEGFLRWIVYTDLCPKMFDYRPAYSHIKSIFDLPENLAWDYCEAHAPGMEENNYLELDHVFPNGSD